MAHSVQDLVRVYEARNMLKVMCVRVYNPEDLEESDPSRVNVMHIDLQLPDRDVRHRLVLDILKYANIESKADDILEYTYSYEYYRSGTHDLCLNEFNEFTTGVNVRIQDDLSLFR